jgi:hypothetical protein
MSLFSAHVGLFSNDNAVLRAVRREHDEWMRTAILGQPYWTLKPAIPLRNDLPWTYDIHLGPIIFTGPAGFGLPNQLLTNGSTSWKLWKQHGPLTRVPQQTVASYEAANMPAHERGMADMRRAVTANISTDWTDAMQEVQRKYPQSAKTLVGAR